MNLDIQSIIQLPLEICGTVIATDIMNAMPYSLTVLQKHYKLNSLKIVLILKTLSHKEYVIAQSER